MKNLFFLSIIGLFVFSACGDDDSSADTPDYHIHINSPTTDDKHVGDELSINITAEDLNGGTVHHFNVRIYNKTTGEEFINKPDDAHVHETDGEFEFSATKILDVTEHTDWIVEVKVWGEEDGLAEVSETLEFHVHP